MLTNVAGQARFMPLREGEGGGGGDNSAIQQMRAQIDTMKADLDAAKSSISALTQERDNAVSELDKFKDSEKTEIERLQGQIKKQGDELSELRPFKSMVEESDKTFEGLYTKRLQDIPEEKRESAMALTSDGSWASRFSKIDTLAKDFVAPVKNGIGNPTNPSPGTGGKPDEGKKYDLKDAGSMPWGEAVAAKR